MYKLLVLFSLFAVNQVYCNEKFEIFRSANIQLSKASHKESDLAAFHLDEMQNAKADLDNEKSDEKTDEAETHPIDFKKINLNKYQAIRNETAKKDAQMQNDEMPIETRLDNGKRSRKYQMRMRKSSSIKQSTSRNELNSAKRQSLIKNQIVNYDNYCSSSQYLAECLKKRLSSKFLVNFKSQQSSNSVMENLNRLNSYLQLSRKQQQSSSLNLKQMYLALDRTFYNNQFLGQILTSCILSFEKNCELKF